MTKDEFEKAIEDAEKNSIDIEKHPPMPLIDKIEVDLEDILRGGCPFLDSESDDCQCSKDSVSCSRWDDVGAPDNCPLRKHPILVMAKAQDVKKD